jgi:RNA polymerase sigma-70 factor (ECF subfamily)
MLTYDFDILMRQAASLGNAGALARREGDESQAEQCFRNAFELALQALKAEAENEWNPSRLETLRATAILGLECGETAEARRLAGEALAREPSVAFFPEWEQLRNADAWPDVWLVAAVRRDPPDARALDVLANRYWKPLFARCQLLALNYQKANDLAQEAWRRVLRARTTLKPGGNFPAFLTTVATNIWRDSNRSARRAGPLAEHRMASLDATFENDDGETTRLADTVPDLSALNEEQKRVLAIDIDEALNRLTPTMRDILVSRLLAGESCAEIGRRYKRTEQTISAWVRAAIREIKQHLREPEPAAARKD